MASAHDVLEHNATTWHEAIESPGARGHGKLMPQSMQPSVTLAGSCQCKAQTLWGCCRMVFCAFFSSNSVNESLCWHGTEACVLILPLRDLRGFGTGMTGFYRSCSCAMARRWGCQCVTICFASSYSFQNIRHVTSATFQHCFCQVGTATSRRRHGATHQVYSIQCSRGAPCAMSSDVLNRKQWAMNQAMNQ